MAESIDQRLEQLVKTVRALNEHHLSVVMAVLQVVTVEVISQRAKSVEDKLNQIDAYARVLRAYIIATEGH